MKRREFITCAGESLHMECGSLPPRNIRNTALVIEKLTHRFICTGASSRAESGGKPPHSICLALHPAQVINQHFKKEFLKTHCVILLYAQNTGQQANIASNDIPNLAVRISL